MPVIIRVETRIESNDYVEKTELTQRLNGVFQLGFR